MAIRVKLCSFLAGEHFLESDVNGGPGDVVTIEDDALANRLIKNRGCVKTKDQPTAKPKPSKVQRAKSGD